MGKRKSYNFIVDLKVYPYDIMFSFGQTDDDFKKCCSDVMQDEYYVDLIGDDICEMRHSLRGRTFHHLISGQTIIRMPNIPKEPHQMGTLSHEIFHAVTYIFSRIGIQLVPQSDEAFAYLIGYITEQVWNEIK